MSPTVIVGTGLTGFTLARELRKLDTESPLLLVTAGDGRLLGFALTGSAVAEQQALTKQLPPLLS